MKILKTLRKDITSCNILSVEAGTNCPQGGDTGHGGKTFVKISNDACTNWAVRVRSRNGIAYEGTLSSLELFLGGDTECATIIEALRFAADTLAAQSQEGPFGRDVETSGIPEDTVATMLRYY